MSGKRRQAVAEQAVSNEIAVGDRDGAGSGCALTTSPGRPRGYPRIGSVLRLPLPCAFSNYEMTAVGQQFFVVH